MGGFTRLVASEDGKPDGLEAEMPSFFVRQYTTAEIARYGHFGGGRHGAAGTWSAYPTHNALFCAKMCAPRP